MAQSTTWKCEVCQRIGPETEFETPTGQHLCSICGSEDVFPYRLMRCKNCGQVQDQYTWFPEFPLDDNPLREKDPVPAEPCEKCAEKREAEISKNGRAFFTQEEADELEELREKPAELEEIEVTVS